MTVPGFIWPGSTRFRVPAVSIQFYSLNQRRIVSVRLQIPPESNGKIRLSVRISINLCEANSFTAMLFPLSSFKINTLSGNYQSVSLPMIRAIYKWTPTSQLQAPPIWIHFLLHNIVVKTKRFCYSKLHSVYNLYRVSMAVKILSGHASLVLFRRKNIYFWVSSRRGGEWRSQEGGTCSFIPQTSVSHETDHDSGMFPNPNLQYYNDNHFFYIVNSHFNKNGK